MKKDSEIGKDIPTKEVGKIDNIGKNEKIKSDEEIKKTAYAFYNDFSSNYWSQRQTSIVNDRKRIFLEDVKALDLNTDTNLSTSIKEVEENITKEEILQLEENDPGYVNGKVLDYDNEENSELNTYKTTGMHTGAVHWGHYATREGVEYLTLKSGMLLSRWGDENGSFLSNIDTSYNCLELPTIQEKNKQNLYEVLKPFPVEVSKIAKQPWNKQVCEVSDTSYESAIQYRTPVPINELLIKGYLKKLI